VYRVEHDVGLIPAAKLEPVAAFQRLPLDARAVDEGAVLARVIDENKPAVLQHDVRVISRDTRLLDEQVFIPLAAHAEWRPVQDDVLAHASLHEDQHWECAGT